MSRYDNILPPKETLDKVLLAIGKGLYDIDPTRSVLNNYKDLPQLGSPYVLIEPLTISTNGMSMGEQVYEDVLSSTGFYKDNILSQQGLYRITAAHDSPLVYLSEFMINRYETDWWWKFFNKEDVGITQIGEIIDTSLPVENGDWEIRYSLTIEVNYLIKKTVEVVPIETIDYSWSIEGGDQPLQGDGSATL